MRSAAGGLAAGREHAACPAARWGRCAFAATKRRRQTASNRHRRMLCVAIRWPDSATGCAPPDANMRERRSRGVTVWRQAAGKRYATTTWVFREGLRSALAPPSVPANRRARRRARDPAFADPPPAPASRAARASACGIRTDMDGIRSGRGLAPRPPTLPPAFLSASTSRSRHGFTRAGIGRGDPQDGATRRAEAREGHAGRDRAGLQQKVRCPKGGETCDFTPTPTPRLRCRGPAPRACTEESP